MSKSPHPNTCYAVWNNDACGSATIAKSAVPNTCHRVWNVDAFEGIAVSVFVNVFISIICALNDRKVKM